MRMTPVRAATLAATALAAVACSGLPQPSTGLPGASGALPTLPPVTLPPVTLPSALPSIGPLPSVDSNADPALAARFPATLENSEVGTVSTSRFIDLMSAILGAPTGQQISAVLSGAGLDANSVTYGTQNITMNEKDVIQLEAIHTPGADASRIIAIWPQLVLATDPTASPPIISESTVGGKSVTVVGDPTSHPTYLFATGDVAWRVQGGNDAELTTLFNALH
jgi:hypothetical protein